MTIIDSHMTTIMIIIYIHYIIYILWYIFFLLSNKFKQNFSQFLLTERQRCDVDIMLLFLFPPIDLSQNNISDEIHRTHLVDFRFEISPRVLWRYIDTAQLSGAQDVSYKHPIRLSLQKYTCYRLIWRCCPVGRHQTKRAAWRRLLASCSLHKKRKLFWKSTKTVSRPIRRHLTSQTASKT